LKDRSRGPVYIYENMTVRLNFGQHWFQFDRMSLKSFS
jgi:hypothetical protein